MITPYDALAIIGSISLFIVAARIGIYVVSSIVDDRRARYAAKNLVGRMYWRSGPTPTKTLTRTPPRWIADHRYPFPPAPSTAQGVNPQCSARRGTVSIVLTAILIAVTAAIADAAPPPVEPVSQPHASPTIEVHFSPNGGCTESVVALILSAHGSVRLAGYQFTSEPVARALIDAHDRGRDVQVIVDRSSAKTKQVGELRAAGVTVLVDSRHKIFHDKFVVVDGSAVETGSFNYTESAERSNAENCVVIRDAVTARMFAANWLGHAAHASGGGS